MRVGLDCFQNVSDVSGLTALNLRELGWGVEKPCTLRKQFVEYFFIFLLYALSILL